MWPFHWSVGGQGGEEDTCLIFWYIMNVLEQSDSMLKFGPYRIRLQIKFKTMKYES